jgi:hypothetical protein
MAEPGHLKILKQSVEDVGGVEKGKKFIDGGGRWE